MNQTPKPSPWKCALELRQDRSVATGSHAALCHAIRRGADLRVYSEWFYEEHVAPFIPAESDPRHNGLLQENIDFRETILVDDSHVAGITTLRQPILPCGTGYNGRVPKMSFFMYTWTRSNVVRMCCSTARHRMFNQELGRKSPLPRMCRK